MLGRVIQCNVCVQVRELPLDAVHVQVWSVDSHRLAMALDKRGKLLRIVRGALLSEMGLPDPSNMRLVNLL
jgi:hypothetical protein